MIDDRMITCREAVEQLWAYIDGELENTDVNSVEEHLEACKGCYPHYDFQKAFREFVRRHADRAVPADLRKRIFLRLLAEDHRESADSPGTGDDAGAGP
jgi:anti-sigma factor (TIGR02949 family)